MNNQSITPQRRLCRFKSIFAGKKVATTLRNAGLLMGLVITAAGLTPVPPQATTPEAPVFTETHRQAANAVPKVLAAADWKSICAVHAAQRHAIASVTGGGYRAFNPGQQWQTHFDGRGFCTQPEKGDWSWGLELRSYGFVGHERTVDHVATATAERDRVVYERGEGLQEWFITGLRGLEQGFTLAERPAGGGTGVLEFHFRVRGNLHSKISSDGSEISFVAEGGTAVVNYGQQQVLDAAGKKVPAQFVASARGDFNLRVDARGALYPLTIDPIAQQAYLKAFNANQSDIFGSSTAISGDTVIVGAIGEASNATGVNGNETDNSAFASGAAYVFVRNGATGPSRRTLKLPTLMAMTGLGAP